MAKFDLLTTLSLNAAGFTQGIDRAKKSTQGFQSTIKSIGGFLAPVLGAAGAIGVLKSSIEAVEGTGDKFAEVIGGGKEAIFEFQRAIATMDFSNFLQNIKDGFARGSEFAALLDELADKTAYSDYKISQLNIEKGQLEEIAKDKRNELSVRSDAASKILDIAEKIQKRHVELAQETFNVEKRSWEGRNKMATDEAIKLYETIDNLSSEVEDTLAKSFEYQTSLFGKKKGAEMILSGEAQRGILKGIPEEVIQSYGKYFALLQTGEAEVLPKLFATSKKLAETQYNAQVEYNGTLKQTTTLIEKQTKAKKEMTLAEMQASKANPIKKIGTSNITLPTFSSGIQTPNTLAPMDVDAANKVIEHGKAIAFALEQQEMLNAAMERQQEIFDAMAYTLSEGADSFKDYAKVVKSAIKGAIGAMIAEGVTTMILAGMKTAGLSGPGALILAPILAAAGAGLAKTAFNSMIPAFANGGVSMGGMALVGERGAELVNLPRGSQVFSNSQSRNMLSGGEVVFRIEGNALVGVLNNHNRRSQSFA